MKYLKYFESIDKYYYCGFRGLTTLKMLNVPKHVINFTCSNNKLSSLEFCPEFVDGDFNCDNNEITSLQYFPKIVEGGFSCSLNRLTSLKYCQEIINGIFWCNHNQLTTLEFCPKIIKSNFNCEHNKLTSLEFGPEIVNGSYCCSNNQLISLDFIPNDFGGVIKCNKNNWVEPIPYMLIEKHNINMNEIYTNDQIQKFGSYEYQKEFLANTPEKYKDLEVIGYNDEIKEEFDWLFNAADMGLM